MFKFLLIISSVFLNSLAQIFLKVASGKLNNGTNTLTKFKLLIFDLNFLMGFLCYGVSILIWIYVLSKVPVSIAYPMQSMGYIIGVLLAYFFLKESLNLSIVSGLILITVGVVLIARQI